MGFCKEIFSQKNVSASVSVSDLSEDAEAGGRDEVFRGCRVSLVLVGAAAAAATVRRSRYVGVDQHLDEWRV